ncbi:hypothetical protein NL676_022882 [Syzygium grande]|nr:hypothetical protein NL676_022882 [Syzygium grande]
MGTTTGTTTADGRHNRRYGPPGLYHLLDTWPPSCRGQCIISIGLLVMAGRPGPHEYWHGRRRSGDGNGYYDSQRTGQEPVVMGESSQPTEWVIYLSESSVKPLVTTAEVEVLRMVRPPPRPSQVTLAGRRGGTKAWL